MRNIASVADLKDAISELEFNKAVHRRMLKDSFNDTLESLKPQNIFRNLTQAVKNPSLLSNIIPAIVGLGAGFVSNRITKKDRPWRSWRKPLEKNFNQHCSLWRNQSFCKKS